MEVEDVTRVCLTTRRSTKEEGHLTIGYSLLGKIIIDNKSCMNRILDRLKG